MNLQKGIEQGTKGRKFVGDDGRRRHVLNSVANLINILRS